MRAVATPEHRSRKVKLIPWRAFRPPAAVPPFALFPPALCAPAFLDSDFFDCPGFVRSALQPFLTPIFSTVPGLCVRDSDFFDCPGFVRLTVPCCVWHTR